MRPLRVVLVPVGLLAGLCVAAALFAACGGDDGDGGDQQAEEVIKRFLQIGQAPGAEAEVLLGELPPDLPEGLPQYPGSSLVGSTVTTGEQQKGFTVIYESGDSLDEIIQFYEEKMDEGRWQVLLSTSSETFGAVQFGGRDDTSTSGAVAVQQSARDEASTILLSVQLTLPASATGEPFELPPSKPLPRGFPAQVPVISDITVTDTAWARSTEGTDFQLSFLTEKSQQDVLDFYRSELKGRGWTVTEEAPQGGVSGLSFEISAVGQTWTGAVAVTQLSEDAAYTQGRLQARIGAATEEATPAPTVTPGG